MDRLPSDASATVRPRTCRRFRGFQPIGRGIPRPPAQLAAATLLGVALFLGGVPHPSFGQTATPRDLRLTTDRVFTADSLPPHAQGEVLVKFKKGIGLSQKRGLHASEGADVISEIREIGVDRVKSARGESTETLLQRYKNNPLVEYAEPNVLVHTHGLPNDARFSELWGLHNVGQSGGTPDADIDAPEAWDLQTGSQQVVVADIDTGVLHTHEDLAANMWTNPGEIPDNNIDDDGNGYEDDYWGWDFYADVDTPSDYHGHGTLTSGTIGAVGNNTIGVVGVAWRVKIMSLRFLDSNGFGQVADAIPAIIYAADMGARIANNSWACGPSQACFSQALEDAIAYANARGMLFVASAGNASNNNDLTPVYPCNSSQPNVICVAATDRNDQHAGFSNYGLASVDLSAPGVDVLSTVPSAGGCALCDASGYQALSGTSLAAPHVSGAAALLLSQFPSLTVAELKALILGSVDPVFGQTATGGRLNVNRALRTNFVISVSPTELTIPPDGFGSYAVTVTSRNAFAGQVTLSLRSDVAQFLGTFSPSIVSVPANGSAVATLTVSASGFNRVGRYQIVVQGSEPSGGTGIGPAGLAIGTDLAIQEVEGPSDVYRGQLITVADRVVNQGTGDWLNSDLYVTYYFSADGTITADDIKIGSRMVGRLAAGAESSGSTEVIVPGEMLPGSYTLGAIVDRAQRVPDLNRANNTLAGGTLLVAPGSDVPPTQEWSVREPFPRVFFGMRQEILALDGSGNVYVTHHLPPDNTFGSNVDYSTTKFDSAGNQIWNAKYDSGLDDVSTAIWVDVAGNVYVTGYRSPGVFFGIGTEPTSHQPGSYPVVDFQTVKYDANGNLVWVRVYNSGETDIATAISGDTVGNVYVTGVCCDVNPDFATVKYDANGNQVWIRRHVNLGYDVVSNLAVDPLGDVYISGSAWNGEQYEYRTIKYGADGTERWVRGYSGGVVAALAVDGAGSVFVTGASNFDQSTGANTSVDYMTVKYDSSGNLVWVNRYDDGTVDAPEVIAVDASGNVYVTGSSMGELDLDYATVKYDSGGRQRWVARYDHGHDDSAFDMAIDPFGGAYVSGTSDGDYLILKYDPAGNQVWSVRSIDGEWPVVVGVDEAQQVYVTGMSKPNPNITDYLTQKYAQQGFSVSAASGSVGAEPGSSASSGLAVKALGTFAGAVALSCVPASADPTVTCSVFPNLVTVSTGGTAAATVLISTTVTTPIGRKTLVVRATGVDEIYSVPIDLVVGPAGPDLLVNALTIAATSVPAGGSLIVTDSVLNQGLTATGAFAVHYRLSRNGIYGDADDVVVSTTRSMSNLDAGVASSVPTAVTLPVAVSPGTYHVCAKADGGGVVSEVNEGNNALCSASTVAVPPIDLVITDVTPNSTMVVPGGFFSVSTTVQNQGGSPATAFTVEMHLSSDVSYGGLDDIVLTPLRTLSSLGAGAGDSGATTLSVPPATPLGSYYVCAMADNGQVINEDVFEGNNTGCSFSAISVVADDASMISVSTRARVQTGDNVMIGGFWIEGPEPKTVMIRARGGSLGGAPFNHRNVLADPTVQLYSGSRVIAQNDDWQTTDPLCDSPATACGGEPEISATGLDPCQPNPGQTAAPPGCAEESAILVTLAPGGYTAIVSGADGTVGMGLTEVFDINTGPSTLIALSTRARVETGDNVMIGGFWIGGTVPKAVLLRARGGSLGGAPFNNPGVLANPTFQLFSGGTVIAQNNDWQATDPLCLSPATACGTAAQVTATGFAPCQPNPGQTVAPPGCGQEAAILVTLAPGGYTAIVSGFGGTSGMGLVEVFEVP